MEIAFCLVIALLAAAVAMLVLLRAGIRRQERAASLASEPCSLSAAITRRVLGLHVSSPTDVHAPRTAGCPDQLLSDGKARHS